MDTRTHVSPSHWWYPAKHHVATAVKLDPRLEFLAPLVPLMVPIAQALEIKKKAVATTEESMDLGPGSDEEK